ncbi:hypothetical protein [Planotetraspora kaengkrachanensis]|uniref:hypothetical protein n=1 Tax=Planotetraspora kaengkrachanensis TaxID=575193 RepID=UPI001941D371|nr:hypothetical protein [Planotetraspora kaengkrachanensis]
MGVVVLKVDIRRLREPAALVMLAVVATNVLVGLVRLLAPSGSGAAANSFALRSATALRTFTSPLYVILIVVAVLLVSRFGERTARAQLVDRLAAGTLGLSLLFSVITTLGVLFGGDALDFRDKFESLIVGLPSAGLVFLGLAFVINSAKGIPAAAWSGTSGGEAGYDAQRAGNGYPQDPYASQGYAQGYGQAPQGQPAASDGAAAYGQLAAPVDGQYAAQDPYGSLYADRSQADAYGAQAAYPQQAAQGTPAQPQQQDFQTGVLFTDPYVAGYQQDQSGGQASGANQGYGANATGAAPYGQQPGQQADSTTPGQAYENYPQNPGYDQYGYGAQQPQAGGYPQQPTGGQQDGVGFAQAQGTEGQGFAQGSYQDPGFGQSGSHAAPTQGDPAQQYGQQGGSPFSGYSGPQFAAGADAPSQSPYEQTADPREQQLAQAYQQAQSYQQLGTPTDYPPTPAAPPAADYYGNPLGHPQQESYTAPSDQQTTRLDPPAYQGDALSGPGRREEPLDPTAIYAPERSQAKYEEGSGTDQAGHRADTNPHWYGSER